jgi:hypothetical protein
MALTVGTDTYASLADIQAWNAARGYTGTITEADVLRAMDYIESLPWAYSRYYDQYDPTIAYASTDLWWDDNPPDGVVKALKHASRMENESPGVLMPQTQQRVSKEKVDVIEIEYEPGGNVQMFPALLRYLRDYITSGSVINVRLA